MRSWQISRNTLPGRLWEPTLALSLNVRYLYIGINANVNLSSIFWWTITFQIFFIMGGGVECLLFHTVPPSTKTWCQNFFLTLSWGFRQFLIFQKLCSWKQPRNAFLDDIQERAPGRPPGTRSWTGFGNLHSLNVRYLYIGINANVNLSIILWWTITF